MKKTTNELLKSLKSKPSVDEFLNENSGELIFDTLPDWIEFHMIKKNLNKADVVRASNISRTYAYQIINGDKKPSRDKLVMLCFGLRLTLDETQNILKRNGYSELYPRDLRDSIIIFGILHGKSVVDLNIILAEKNVAILE